MILDGLGGKCADIHRAQILAEGYPAMMHRVGDLRAGGDIVDGVSVILVVGHGYVSRVEVPGEDGMYAGVQQPSSDVVGFLYKGILLHLGLAVEMLDDGMVHHCNHLLVFLASLLCLFANPVQGLLPDFARMGIDTDDDKSLHGFNGIRQGISVSLCALKAEFGIDCCEVIGCDILGMILSVSVKVLGILYIADVMIAWNNVNLDTCVGQPNNPSATYSCETFSPSLEISPGIRTISGFCKRMESSMFSNRSAL